MSKSQKVNYILICENATLSDRKQLSLINIFDQIKVKTLPTVFAKMSVVVNFDIDQENYNIELLIKNQKEELVLPPLKRKEIPTRDKKNVNFVFNLEGILIEEEGELNFIINVDDKEFGRTKLNIEKEK